MILIGLFPPEVPDRCGRPDDSVLAIEGNGRSGRDTGNDGAAPSDRAGREDAFGTSGEDAYGRTEAGLSVDGPADMVMIAGRRGKRICQPLTGARTASGWRTHFWISDQPSGDCVDCELVSRES